MTPADLISQIVEEAHQPGDATEPTALLAALASDDDPINGLSDRERGRTLFECFHSEFPFIRNLSFANRPLQGAGHAQWIGLYRWIIRELRGWRSSDDPRSRRLVAIFVAIHASDQSETVWKLLPGDIGENSELIQILKRLIAAFCITFAAQGIEPIWEREVVDAFVEADARGDWPVIGEKWKLFENVAWPGVLQTQAVRCLFRYSFADLVEALAKLRQTPVAIQVAHVLTTEQALTLGEASENAYVQFACVYQAISGAPRPPRLSDEAEESMVRLLERVLKDGMRWAGWMKFFNAYPGRYPALQTALGKALASAPKSGIDAYVHSVVLYPKLPSRMRIGA